MATRDSPASVAAHKAAIAVSVPALLLNLSLMASILRHRKVLLRRRPHRDSVDANHGNWLLDWALFLILVSCVWNAGVIVSSSSMSLSGGLTNFKGGPAAHLNQPLSTSEIASRYALTVCGYLGLIALFTANLLLALERFHVIRYASSVTSRVLWSLICSAALFLALFVSSFVISNLTSCGGGGFNFKFGRPFAMPGTRINDTVRNLFLLGMSFFPLVIVAVVVLYAACYLTISKMVDATSSSHDGSMDESENGTREGHSSLSIVVLDDEETQMTARMKRTVFYRCLLMSIGCLAFYMPTIFLIIVDRLKTPSGEKQVFLKGVRNGNCSIELSRNSSSDDWTVPTTSILPALDLVWTPLLILLLQTQHRMYYFADVKRSFVWR